MSKLIKVDNDWYLGYCKDDPVRPHIPAHWRVSNGREVYALEDEDSNVEAVICVAYCDGIPISEQELDKSSRPNAPVAVFYTVWSYAKGAGRRMVLETAAHIQETYGCVRYVTLSPLTEMAEKFHLRNGATFLTKGITCQNFEYSL
jgi:hypothetical protein